MSVSPRKRRHYLLKKFCKADRKLLELEKRVGFCMPHIDISSLKESHHEVMERVIDLMAELIPERRHPRAFQNWKLDEFQVSIDIIKTTMVLNQAIQMTKEQLQTPSFPSEHRQLPANVTKTASETFEMLRKEFGRSFHGNDPMQNQSLLQQLEKFDRVLAEFELAWCVVINPKTPGESLLEIQVLGEVFLRTAKWSVDRDYLQTEDFGTCDGKIKRTLPRLAVLRYLTEPGVDSRSNSDSKIFRQHRNELDKARRLLDQLEPSKRDAIVWQLCLNTKDSDSDTNCVFEAIATAVDQMQINHSMEFNYLMSFVCSKDSVETLRKPEKSKESYTAGPVDFAPDSSSTVCTNLECGLKFNLVQRRHHCRSCGGLLCGDCTKRRLPLPLRGHHSPVRVCQGCHDKVLEAMLAKEAPRWVPDFGNESSRCSNGKCRAEFWLVRRRHHCRACGQLFCYSCSSWSASLPQFGYNKAVRLCKYCHSVHGKLERPTDDSADTYLD